MKNLKPILLSTITISLLSCNSPQDKTPSENATLKQNSEKSLTITDLQDMAPIALLHENIKDPFKKYGINFTSNCYACNDTDLTAKDGQIIFTNVCDSQQKFAFTITKTTERENSIELEFDGKKATIEKIDDTPIYELKFDGNAPQFKDSKTSKYYTPKQLIPKFEQHDCGDFEG